MKKRILSIVALAALVALPMSVFAQVPVQSADVEAKATILTSVEIANGGPGGAAATPLNFGTISRSATGGSVTLPAESGNPVRTTTNVTTVGGGQTAANFTITAEPSTTVNIKVPEEIVIENGAASMTITTLNSLDADFDFDYTIPGTGVVTMYVGGTMPVLSTQEAGEYSATFNVTVCYN